MDKKVGVGVGAVILNEHGEVLPTLRNGGANNRAGLWDLPGGTVEFGNKLEETIIREVEEETGLIVTPLYCLGAYQDFVGSQHWVSFAYASKIIGGELQNKEPHKFSDIRYFNINRLPDNISKMSLQIISKYKEGGSTFSVDLIEE